jgi:hypothetical protein
MIWVEKYFATEIARGVLPTAVGPDITIQVLFITHP